MALVRIPSAVAGQNFVTIPGLTYTAIESLLPSSRPRTSEASAFLLRIVLLVVVQHSWPSHSIRPSQCNYYFFLGSQAQVAPGRLEVLELLSPFREPVVLLPSEARQDHLTLFQRLARTGR